MIELYVVKSLLKYMPSLGRPLRAMMSKRDLIDGLLRSWQEPMHLVGVYRFP